MGQEVNNLYVHEFNLNPANKKHLLKFIEEFSKGEDSRFEAPTNRVMVVENESAKATGSKMARSRMNNVAVVKVDWITKSV
jgi:hypothetical protein